MEGWGLGGVFEWIGYDIVENGVDVMVMEGGIEIGEVGLVSEVDVV